MLDQEEGSEPGASLEQCLGADIKPVERHTEPQLERGALLDHGGEPRRQQLLRVTDRTERLGPHWFAPSDAAACPSSADRSPGRWKPSPTTTTRHAPIAATMYQLVSPRTAPAGAGVRTMRPVCQSTPKNAMLTKTRSNATPM